MVTRIIIRILNLLLDTSKIEKKMFLQRNCVEETCISFNRLPVSYTNYFIHLELVNTIRVSKKNFKSQQENIFLHFFHATQIFL